MKHENKKAPIGAFLLAPLMHSCSGLVMQNHSGVDLLPSPLQSEQGGQNIGAIWAELTRDKR